MCVVCVCVYIYLFENFEKTHKLQIDHPTGICTAGAPRYNTFIYAALRKEESLYLLISSESNIYDKWKYQWEIRFDEIAHAYHYWNLSILAGFGFCMPRASIPHENQPTAETTQHANKNNNSTYR